MITRRARSLLKSAAPRLVPARYVTWAGRTEDHRVALTFDDGPHPVHTPAVLSALRDAGVAATFFVLGALVAEHPTLTAEIVSAGHELGNHTYSHTDLRRCGLRRGLGELQATDRLLREVDPGFQGLFRPPWGRLGLAGAAFVLGHRRRAVLWTLDSRDHLLDGAAPIVERVAPAPLVGGSILLFHDDNAFTPAALPSLIHALRQRGFAFATVSDLLGPPARRLEQRHAEPLALKSR
jgi:peptidoglycan/xylan/chitin deacetylase (PgdA/CDA1 family)